MERMLGRTWRNLLVPLCLLLGLAACAYEPPAGGETDNPVSRKFSWLSYLDAADIRAGCTAGSPDRYRFVYNGIYVEQVRTYDVSTGGTDGALVRASVFGPGDLTNYRLSDPLDLLSPWSGRVERIRLRDSDLDLLRDAMTASGVFGPPPVGLRMNSYDFYWVVAACAGGSFHFTAYRWPSDRFDRIAFDDLLLAWDPIEVPIKQPRQVLSTEYQMIGDRAGPDSRINNFDIRVGKNGLVGPGPLF